MTEQVTEDQTPGESDDSVEQVCSPDQETEGTGPIGPTDEPETFPREYVVKLRTEAAEARTKAKRADALAERLHAALVAATGRLADSTDLPFDETHLDDAEALTTAIDNLLIRKPHLASRRPAGDVGQGASKTGETVDLAGMLRARA